MKKLLAIVAVCIASASTARAQDASQIGGMVVAGAQAFAQSVGAAASGGSNVFVTATGHAPLASPATGAYQLNVEGRAASAVEAARLHDQRLAAARALAAKYNVSMDVGSTTLTREVEMAAQMRRAAEARARAQGASTPAPPNMAMVQSPAESNEADRLYVMRTGVRFGADISQLPPFLDALKAAGFNSAESGAIFPPVNLGGSTEILGFGSLAKVDDAVWNSATGDAMASARRQAQVLAASAGRQIGEVKQVMLLTRSVQNSQVSVTVAVSYAFAPQSGK